MMPRWLRTPKGMLAVMFIVLLVCLVPSAGGVSLWPNLAAAVLTGCAIDALCMTLEVRRWRWPVSAFLSGLFVFFILSTSESWPVVAWTSAAAVLTKRVIRTRRGHLFNPAALALLWAPIVFGSGESWWGAFGDQPAWWLVVLIGAGALITDRLNKFPLVLTFLGTYFGSLTLIALSHPLAVAELFRAPFLQAALFLAFFMLTDPPTSPNRLLEQVWFGLIAAGGAVVAQLLGAGQIYLVIGVLAANLGLAGLRLVRRQGVAPALEQLSISSS